MRWPLIAFTFMLCLIFELPKAKVPQMASPLPFVHSLNVEYQVPQPVGTADDGILWMLLDDQVGLADEARYHRTVRKIVSVAGLENASEVEIEFDPGYQKALVHHLRIIRGGQVIDCLKQVKPSLMQRENLWDRRMLDGRTTALYILRDVRVGDVIDFAHTIQGENPVFEGRLSGRQYLAYGVPMMRRHFRIVAPENRPIQFTRRANAAPYTSRSTPHGIEYFWDVFNLPSMTHESQTPAWHLHFPRIEWSEFRDWTEVVRWAQHVYVLPDRLSEAMEQLVAQWMPLNPDDRLSQALRFVQDSVRYLGMEMGAYSHAPRPPDSVFMRRFGDCKEKTMLLCALLRRLDLHAEPVLINTWAGASLVDQNPSPLAFDHVIARVKWSGQYLYFDPTVTSQRGRPSQADAPPFAFGLPVSDSVYGPIGIDPPISSKTHVEYDFAIASWEKPGKVTVRTLYSGHEADRVRREWGSTQYADIAKSYREYLGRFFRGLRAVDSIRIDDNTVQNKVTTVETYAIDSLCQAIDRYSTRQCEFAPIEINEALTSPNSESRKAPYKLAWPKKISVIMRLNLPQDYGILRSQGEARHEDFLYTWNEYGRGNKHTLEYHYEALNDHVPASRFAEYVHQIALVRSDFGVSYPATASDASLFSGRLNSFWILFMTLCLAASVVIARFLLKMKPLRIHLGIESSSAIFATSPRRIGGWLYLVGFGLVVGLIAQAWKLKDLAPFFKDEMWDNLTSREGRAYHPAWEPLLIFEGIYNTVGLAAMAVCCWLFFRRFRHFPRVYILVFGILAGLQFIYAASILALDLGDLLEFTGNEMRTAVIGMISIGLWSLYLVKSVRVRETFVLSLPEPASTSGSRSNRDSEDGYSGRVGS
jgi:transglutaminase-like putative cysteine protease